MTFDKFAKALKSSELIAEDEFKKRIAEFRSENGAADNAAADFAKRLVKDELLTEWQAKKLLQGKNRGFRVGQYKLINLLGKGGMGSVFLAEHEVMSRRVAVKILPQPKFRKPSYLARFKREARAVAALDHPNIVRAFDFNTEKVGDTELNYFIMEYVDGASLHEIVRKRGPMSPIEAVHYLRQAANGLAHAHDGGLIHRDIKPDNLLVDREGTVKILDLGLARFVDEEANSLTVEHNDKVIGTTDYLSPEQAVDSHSVDLRADIYALGCTLFFMLTGQPPFAEGTMAQRLIAHQTKEPPKLKQFRRDVPASLEAIMLRLMSKDAADRPQTALEVSALLADWLSEQVGASTSQIAPPSGVFDGGVSSVSDGSSTLTNRIQGAFSGVMSAAVTSNVHARSRASEMLMKRPGLSAAVVGGVATVLLVVGTIVGSILTSDKDLAASTETPDPATEIVPTQSDPNTNVGPVSEKTASSFKAMSPAINGDSIDTVPEKAVAVASAANTAAAVMPKPESPAPEVTWDPVDKPSKNEVVTVGRNGQFKRIRQALNHVRQNYAPVDESEGVTIELEAGQTFEENVVVGTGKIPDFPAFVTIKSDVDNPARILGDGTSPALHVKFVQDFTIQNVICDANGAENAIEILGFVRSCRFAGLDIKNFEQKGIYGNSATANYQRRTFFEGITIWGAGDGQIGVHLTSEKRPAIEFEFTGCRFLGPFDAAMRITGSAKSIFVNSTIFANAESGIHFDDDSTDITRLQTAGNTFYRTKTAFLFDSMPSPESARCSISKSLFSEVETEFRVGKSMDREAIGKLFSDGGWIGANFSMRSQPQVLRDDEYTIVKPNAFRINDPGFLSTIPTSSDYLRPSHEQLVDNQFGEGNVQKFIGAVPGK